MTFAAAVDSLEDLQRQARLYPHTLLPDGGTGLALFAAGFRGWNDCIHMARKGMRVDCVDRDDRKLREMADIYPDDWSFTTSDAWEFAEEAMLRGRTWDVVSVDPYLGDAADRAADTLYLWCGLALKLVTITVASRTQLNVPDGWTASYFPRSATAAWMVLKHA